MSEGINPLIALTSGEPAGVGLELAIGAWQKLRGKQAFFLIADRKHLRDLEKNCPLVEIQRPGECHDLFKQSLPFLHVDFPTNNSPGTYNPQNARGVVAAIEVAVKFALEGKVSAVCTNPITKDAFGHAGKGEYSGHTEYISHLCKVNFPVMMLAGEKLKVVPVTRHLPLRLVPQNVTYHKVKKTIALCLSALRKDFGLLHPRIVVAGMNPHAGEGGLLGAEEMEIIDPVIKEFKSKGENVQGPFSADTMFHDDFRETYDLAVAMFHDQALIPIKTIDFYKSVNVTLGLPIIRTSPDHGTALDKAGKWLAKPDSLIEAIVLAGKIHKFRSKNV